MPGGIKGILVLFVLDGKGGGLGGIRELYGWGGTVVLDGIGEL